MFENLEYMNVQVKTNRFLSINCTLSSGLYLYPFQILPALLDGGCVNSVSLEFASPLPSAQQKYSMQQIFRIISNLKM